MNHQELDQLYRDWLIHISKQRQEGMISDRLDLTSASMFIDFCKEALNQRNESPCGFVLGDIVEPSDRAIRLFGSSPSEKGIIEGIIRQADVTLVTVRWSDGLVATTHYLNLRSVKERI